jgi:drug/metabolite transporter (DMT)-like permease
MSHELTAAARSASRPQAGHRLMVASGLLLGTVGIFVGEAGQDPATTVWCRCVFGLAALLAWGAATGRSKELVGLRSRALALVAGSGALTIASWGLFFAAIPRCSIAVSTVVFHLQPFWLLALAAVFLRERATRAQLAAVAVALPGLALASGLADPNTTDRSAEGYLVGVALSFCGSFAYAGSSLLARLATDRSASSYALAAGPCAVGALALAPWPLLHGLPGAVTTWAWLAGLGFLHTGLAYVLMYAGMALLPTGRFAVLQFVYPATAVIVDWIVYGRALAPWQVLGVAMMGGALWALRQAPTATAPG